MTTRTTRANGEASRRRILDAAREIAGERGYSATSISLVSKKSGLPNSSIYWHFTDKDALFAAVIEDSFQQWREDFQARSQQPTSSVGEVLIRLHDSLASFPEFLRFGQIVTLEQHDLELGARTAFISIRRNALADLAKIFIRVTDCDKADADQLAALSLALIDGAFIAGVAGEKTLQHSSLLGEVFDAFVAQKKSAKSKR